MLNAEKYSIIGHKKEGNSLEKKKKTVKPVKSSGSVKDIYAMRKRRKRRKILRQSTWLLLLAVVILVLYQRRDSWMPKLDPMGVRHQSQQQGIGDADGNFPIYLYGDSVYQLAESGGHLLLLNDSYLNFYEQDGTLASVRQHTYGNAMLQTAGDYGLLYESGGTRFRLETPAKLRYEKTVSDQIIFGRVSDNGYAAIVTDAEDCSCRLFVFNSKGQQIYSRNCVERISEIAFNADSTGCYAVRIEAENGLMKSVVNAYDFSSTDTIWSSQALDILAISVYNTSEGNLFILGDNKCCFLDSAGNPLSSYAYPDELVRGCFSGNTAALLFRNDEKRTNSVVVINGPDGSPAIRSYDKDVRDIGLMTENEAVLVQLRSGIETLSYQCNLMQTTPLSDSYDGFLRIGRDLYLKGYDQIARLEYQPT